MGTLFHFPPSEHLKLLSTCDFFVRSQPGIVMWL